MIKKSGYIVLAILSSAILEAIMMGYSYYIIAVLFLFFIVSMDIIIFNYESRSALNNINIEVKLSTTLFRKKQKSSVYITFENQNKYSIKIKYFDEALDILNIGSGQSGIINLKPGEIKKVSYIIYPKFIGKYRLGNIKVVIYDMLNLAYTVKNYPRETEIKIAPSRNDLKASRSEMLSSFIYTFGVHRSRKAGQGYGMYGVRQYTDMDDPRYIVWSRYQGERNTVMVKEMEDEREITVYFVIDYSTAMNYGETNKIYDSVITDILNTTYYINKNGDNAGFVIYSSSFQYFIKADKNGRAINKLEGLVANILPDGNFELENALNYLKKNVKKKPMVFIISASDMHVRTVTQFQNINIMLINISSFFDYNIKDSMDYLMYGGLKKHQYTEMKSKIEYIRQFGYRATGVDYSNMIFNIMKEYNYSRNYNVGAM